MPMRPPRICGCGKKVPSGVMCPCQAARKKAKEAQRPSASQRGYGSKWAAASAAFLAKPENGSCYYCGEPAELVDHAVAHKGDMKLFWDRSNWRPSCARCNRRKNARYEGGFGNPIREYDQ